MDIKAIQVRLNRIEGQIRGLSEMVGRDVPCDEILIQIGAAKAALHRVGEIVLEGHLKHCVLKGIQEGDAEMTMNELADVIEQFSKMA